MYCHQMVFQEDMLVILAKVLWKFLIEITLQAIIQIVQVVTKNIHLHHTKYHMITTVWV